MDHQGLEEQMRLFRGSQVIIGLPLDRNPFEPSAITSSQVDTEQE